MSRDEHYIRMIQAKEWQRLRKTKIERNPLCECCAEKGLIVPAAEVHHKTPVESAVSVDEMRRLMYDFNNLESLCHECHVKRHKEMKSHSKASIRGRNDKRNERFTARYLD